MASRKADKKAYKAYDNYNVLSTRHHTHAYLTAMLPPEKKVTGRTRSQFSKLKVKVDIYSKD